MAEENNKYHRRLNKLLQERINRKKEFEEIQRRKEEVEVRRQNEKIEEIKQIPLVQLENAFNWYSDNKLFNNNRDKSEMNDALSNLSDKEKVISYEQAKLCDQILNEFIYKGDYEKRILDIKYTNLQKALENSKVLSSKEKKLLKQTIIKLSNNEYSQISYQEAKISVKIHDDIQFYLDESDFEMSNQPTPAIMNEKVSMSYEMSASQEYQEKDIFVESFFLNKMIIEIQDLLEFSKKLDDNFIVSYVDGHTDEADNGLFERLIRIDEELEKEVRLLMKANSFFGRAGGEIKDNPKALEELIKFESDLKKNEEFLAKDTLEDKSLLSKLKDFITFKPLDFSFAAITPLFVGAGLLYGTNSTIVALNPAIIQLSSLSSDSEIYLESVEKSFPGSTALISRGESVMRYNKIILMPDCSLPEFKLDPKIFNKQFQIMVTNPKTKKTFQFTDKDKLLAGNEIQFYFDHNKKGTIYIDNVIPSNEDLRILNKLEKTPCKTENFLTTNYEGKTKTKIGETFYINPPWRKERIIIFFKDEKSEKKYPIGLLNYQPTTLEIFNSKFMNLEWKKKKNIQELERKGLYKLFSKVFKKTLYAPNIKSWKNMDDDKDNTNNIFIDFDGDNRAEIIAIGNEEKNIEYYVFDTNKDAKGDILVYPKIEANFISYEWLIDTNYDGFIDQMGYDQNGDWKIEKTKDM